MPRRPLLHIDDVDEELAVWRIEETGTVRHLTSDFKISPETGVTCDGKHYSLSAGDIAYTDGTPVGQGRCGLVWRGEIKTLDLPVAIKAVNVEEKVKRDQLLSEVRGLIRAEGSPHLITWYGAFVSRSSGAVHVVLEWMDRGSLADLKQLLGGAGMPELQLSCVAAQMVRGLAHLHCTSRVMHRDIKPENVLVNSMGEVKLTDFGISKELASTPFTTPLAGAAANTPIGTHIYMSPERCSVDEYSFASDIWSIGIVLYELATGRHPFAGIRNISELYELLCERPEPRLDPGAHAFELCDLVAQCLTADAPRRPHAAELLQHPLVAQAGSQDDLAAWLFFISKSKIVL